MLRLRFLLVSFVATSAAIGGVEILDIDSLIGSKGLFGGQTLAISSFDSISSSVGKFSSILSLPGVLNLAYAKYAGQFGKSSADDSRKDIFKSTILNIFGHNLKAKNGKETYTMGVNQFSDMTLEEVKAKYTGVIFPNNTRIERNLSPNLNINSPELRSRRGAPDSRDWRSSGVVTPPKNQQGCGSCTCFALTGALESAMGIYKNTTGLDLSEQELVDCPTGAGVARCSGNWPEDIYEYQKNSGQTIESLYKYTAKEGSCKAAGKARYGRVRAYFRATEGNEDAMKEYVGIYGPSSVVITINKGFMNYKSGVMTTPCDKKTYDHSVLAVGYGTDDNGHDYWIVKNSWGTGWGDGGFIKMARNAGSMCRIADYVILPQA